MFVSLLARHRLQSRGFTLIELLVVIAIIGLLSSIVFASVNSARGKAKIAKAQADLKQIELAIALLYDSTGLHPGRQTITPCVQDAEVFLNQPGAGIESTDGGFPGWNGPYMSKVPLDPWGINYYYDPDYLCGPTTLGCNGSSQTVRVIQSFGPDNTQTYGNGDDIVIMLCR